MIKKILYLSISLIFGFSNYGFGNNILKPSVDYEDKTGERVIGFANEGNPQKPEPRHGAFGREINESKNTILLFDQGGLVETSETKIENYTLINVRYIHNYLSDLRSVERAIYILRQNEDKTIGYCLLAPININGFPDDAVIKQIKMLKPNNNFLLGQLKMPEKSKVEFYEKNHENFIERYAIAKSEHLEYLLIEMFIPKELDNQLKPRIIRSINKFMRKIYLFDLLYFGSISKELKEELFQLEYND
jgi:hypothetical protein